jgi:hypothetical protein
VKVNGRCEGVAVAGDAGSDASTEAGDATAADAGDDSGVPAVGLGLLTACTGTENVMALRGEKGDITIETAAVIHEGTKKWFGGTGSTTFNAYLTAYPREMGVGYAWSVGFQMAKSDVPLVPGTYENAGFNHPESTAAGRPGMSAQVEGNTCFNLEGRFQIHEVEFEKPDGFLPELKKLVASFERVCPGSMTKVAGCVRWQRTP